MFFIYSSYNIVKILTFGNKLNDQNRYGGTLNEF